MDTYTWRENGAIGITGLRPEPRYGHSQITLDDERVLIVGGCGGPNKQYEDAWILHWPRSAADRPSWELVRVANAINSPSQLYCIPFVQCGRDKLVTFGRARAPPPQLEDKGKKTAGARNPPVTLCGAVKETKERVCSCKGDQSVTQSTPVVQGMIFGVLTLRTGR